MAINSLTFDGINTKDYGIYISGSGAFDAPARRYEMVTVPGRNGQYAIDEGTYDNVEVTYPAFVTDYTQYTFAERMSQIRNIFGSKSGYCKLYDTYNPDEYRLAIFRGGVEVSPKHYNKTGEFNLVFDCKPQRYLVSGETPVSVTSGSQLVNPTYFDARPLIVVEADDDGIVYVNDKTISYNPESIGNIALENSRPTIQKIASASWSASVSGSWSFSRYNSGDAISANNNASIKIIAEYPSVVGYNVDGGGLTNMTLTSASKSATYATFILGIPKSVLNFVAGTSKSVAFSFYGIVEYESDPQSGTLGSEVEFAGTVAYDGTDTITITASGDLPEGASTITYSLESFPSFSVNSSRAAFEGEVYFDTEVCEAYIYGDDGEIISINSIINTGPDYPKLVPGENGISFFGGINSCKFITRWWTI